MVPERDVGRVGSVGLRAGAASRDITPELRGDFFGYVRPDLRARGVALRLHAHALVLEDGARRIGVVTLDLGAPLVAGAVFERLVELGFDRGSLIVAATHTHAGPNRPGRFVVDQVVAAVHDAVADLRPARAAWGSIRIGDANRNRSLEAHLANHGLDLYPGTGTDDLDPAGVDHPRDVGLRLLRVESTDGEPLAAWAHFSAHPTTFVPANTSFSSDFPGVATRRFRDGFARPPVAILTNGTEGDLIPRYDEVNQHACADLIGHRVAAAMHRAWEAAGPGDDHPVLAGATCRIAYRGQRLGPGVQVGSRAWFGLPFIGGGQNGPSFFYGLGLQGRRRPRWLAHRVHGRKLRVAPAPWPPEADVTVLRIGECLLLTVPGEPTVEAGRRMVAAALRAVPTGEVTDALIVGLAQAYRGYFTTPEEFDQQHYEGGHTVFGKHTSRLVERAHAELAATVATRGDAVSGSAAAATPARVGTPATAPAAVLGPGASRLRLTLQPPATVERFATVTIGWRGARRGHDRPVDAPFIVLQRGAGAGGWVPIEDDLGTGIVWEQRGRRTRARYEVPPHLPVGTYRFQIRGTRAGATTRPFRIVASGELRVLGVAHVGRDLVVHAQQPPPDPACVLRARRRRPNGGQVRLHLDGRELVATWDPDRQAWSVPLPGGVPAPARVHLPTGGLVDGSGNRSGPGRDLTVGEVAPERWPPNLGPGGGRAPGPFGLGRAGRPAPWP
jgi:neutral ceramidase